MGEVLMVPDWQAGLFVLLALCIGWAFGSSHELKAWEKQLRSDLASSRETIARVHEAWASTSAAAEQTKAALAELACEIARMQTRA